MFQAATYSLKSNKRLCSIKTYFIFWMVFISVFILSIPCLVNALESIRVKVGVLKDFPPQYSISKSGEPQGFAIEIIETIARLENLEIEYRIYDTWAEMFEALKTGHIDLIPNQGITKERKQWFAFSDPVETFPVSIFTRSNEHQISSIKSLFGKQVAVVKLNIGEVLVQNESSIIVQKYEHVEDALFNLLSGNVDALIFPEPVLWKLATNAGIADKIKVVGRPLTEILRAISVAKDNQMLLNRINMAVEKLIGSDEYKQIFTRWYGQPEPYWNVKRTAGSLMALLIVVVVFMGLWRYHSMNLLNKKLQKSLDKLSTAEEQLRISHDTLERQVKERTFQLTEVIGELETLFNNSQVGIMVFKGEHVFHKGNQRLADILGYATPMEMKRCSMKNFQLTEERLHDFIERYYIQLKNKEMNQIEYQLKRKDGTSVWCTLSGKALDTVIPADLTKGVVWMVDDISRKKQDEIERERLLLKLQNALSEVKQLSGLLPICMHCKMIRDDKGYWNQIEAYIHKHSDVEFSHSICSDCAKKYYPDVDLYDD
ncbi:MAG: transporter substrate-binding domain-containing protein [Desulfobacteraceae bacterium]|nr:transporter substrate-binding domain-containing protein [Desulfobacteraceae bacterium]